MKTGGREQIKLALTLESVTINHSTGSNQWAAIGRWPSGDPLCGDPGSLYTNIL